MGHFCHNYFFQTLCTGPIFCRKLMVLSCCRCVDDSLIELQVIKLIEDYSLEAFIKF